jgi:hypothetical protein
MSLRLGPTLCESDLSVNRKIYENGMRISFNFYTVLLRPDRLWGPPNLLYNGYRELFPGGKAAGA